MLHQPTSISAAFADYATFSGFAGRMMSPRFGSPDGDEDTATASENNTIPTVKLNGLQGNPHRPPSRPKILVPTDMRSSSMAYARSDRIAPFGSRFSVSGVRGMWALD